MQTRAGARRAGRMILVLAALVLGLSAAGMGPIRAQEAAAPPPDPAVTLPDPLTPEAVHELVARLSDAQVRAILIDRLDAAALSDEGSSADTSMGQVDATYDLVRAYFSAIFGATPEFFALPAFFTERIGGEASVFQFLRILGIIALIFLAGAAAEWGFRFLARSTRAGLAGASPRSFGAKAGYCLLRLMLELVGIGIFVLGASACFLLFYEGREAGGLTFVAFLIGVVGARLVAMLSREMFSPKTPNLRLLPFDDRTAAFLHNRVVLFGAIAALDFALMGLLRQLGADPAAVRLFGFCMGAILVALLVSAIWSQRKPVARLIAGPEASALRSALARLWAVLATGYVLGIWLIAVVGAALGLNTFGPAMLSLLLVLLVPLADRIATAALDARFAARAADGVIVPESMQLTLRRSVRLMVVVLGLIALAWAWGFSALDMTGQLGERIVAAAFNIGLTVLLAFVAWQAVKMVIDRRLAAESGPVGVSDSGTEGGTGVSRLATLLPLIRRFLFFAIVVMAVMIVLSSLGVNIGPLLAGAGVIGLAIGFGAQTLVKDVISGMFFLVDDAFRVGEYVDMGSVKGTVEAINVRSLRLRHHRGALHTVPFGEIRHLTNFSRDWAIMKLEFPVPHDTDLMQVKRIFKKIGAELQADPEIGPNLIEPLKSQGVLSVEPHGLIVRAKFMTKPGEQFVVRREVFQRVQQAFAEAAIPFATPQVSVRGLADEDMDEAAAAAHAAVQAPIKAAAHG